MSKLTEPLYSQEAHGRVGGVIYRTHRGAATASVMPSVHSRHSALVSRTLTKMAPARRRWRLMNKADRSVWNRQVKNYKHRYQYGIDPKWSGFNWWIHCALIASYVGVVHLGKPPSEPLASHLLTLNPIQAGAAIAVQYTHFLGPTIWSHWIEVRIMGPHSPGRQPRLKDCKRAGSWLLGFAPFILVNEIPGVYTLYARTVDSQGLTSPHITASVLMEF